VIALGSVKWGTGPIIPITFTYEKQRSGADMQYRVQVTVATITGSSYFGYPIYLDWNVGGSTVDSVVLKKASPSRWTSEIIYTSEWYTVSNKVSGTTEVKFRVYSGSGGNRDNTYTYSMGVDPAASKVSASNGTLATALNLTVTRYNSGFTHTITYKCGSASGTVCTKATATTVAWNTSNGNVLALASQNTAGPTVSVTFTITTYSGTTVIGTDGTTVTMTIPDSVKPSLALSITDAAGYLSTYGAYVQGYSRLRIASTVTLAYGSPVKAFSVIADSKTYNYYSVETVTTGAVQGKGTLTVTAAVADNRSRSSGLVSENITVLEYSRPSVSVNAYRCNSSGAADQEGAYMRVEVDSTISSLNGKNSATYKVVYSGGTLTGNGTSFTSGPLECDVSSIHNIEVTITDKLSSTTKAAVIPIAYTLLDFYKTGRGIAFGKVGTRDGFDCAMDAYFGNKRVQEVGSPTADTDAVNRAYVHDTFAPATEDATYPGCYYRMVGSVKEWLNPPLVVGVEYRTTERYAGKPVYILMKDLGSLPNAGSRTVQDLSANVDRIVDAVFNTANADASYHNAQEVSWYVGSYGWPYCIMKTTTDMSAYTARITIKYTKTTD
jgi:hypothetical protein